MKSLRITAPDNLLAQACSNLTTEDGMILSDEDSKSAWVRAFFVSFLLALPSAGGQQASVAYVFYAECYRPRLELNHFSILLPASTINFGSCSP